MWKQVMRRRRAALGLGLGLGVLLAPTGGRAVEHDPAIVNVAMKHGRVLAHRSGLRPHGDLKLRGFRLEEIELPATRVTLRGRAVEVTRAWRLTVVGGPFHVGDLPPVLWVGDEAIGFGQESADITEISAITFDRDALRDGASIAVSWGEAGRRYALAERLVAPFGKVRP